MTVGRYKKKIYKGKILLASLKALKKGVGAEFGFSSGIPDSLVRGADPDPYQNFQISLSKINHFSVEQASCRPKTNRETRPRSSRQNF